MYAMKIQLGNETPSLHGSPLASRSHPLWPPGLTKLIHAKSKAVRGVILACALSGGVVHAQNQAFITQPGTELARPASARDFVYSDTLLRFVPVYDERGGTAGHIAMEVRRAGEPSVLVEAAKSLRTPTDLFRALSKSRDAFDQFNGPIAHGGGVDDCAASWPDVRDDVLFWGYGLSFLSQSDGPSAGTGHWFASGGFNVGFYELHGRADDVSAFYIKIQFCYEDPVAPLLQGDEGSDVNPTVILQYRLGSSSWRSIELGLSPYLGLPVGEQVNFWWQPIFEPLPDVAANQLDFRLRMYKAAFDDRFHIGATWSKPFGTLTNSN